MQVVINKCFLLNAEKYLAQISFVVFEKNAPLILSFRHPEIMVSGSLETDFLPVNSLTGY